MSKFSRQTLHPTSKADSDFASKAQIFENVEEIFKGKVDADVINLVLEDCDWKAEEAIEKLIQITDEVPASSHKSQIDLDIIACSLLDDEVKSSLSSLDLARNDGAANIHIKHENQINTENITANETNAELLKTAKAVQIEDISKGDSFYFDPQIVAATEESVMQMYEEYFKLDSHNDTGVTRSHNPENSSKAYVGFNVSRTAVCETDYGLFSQSENHYKTVKDEKEKNISIPFCEQIVSEKVDSCHFVREAYKDKQASNCYSPHQWKLSYIATQQETATHSDSYEEKHLKTNVASLIESRPLPFSSTEANITGSSSQRLPSFHHCTAESVDPPIASFDSIQTGSLIQVENMGLSAEAQEFKPNNAFLHTLPPPLMLQHSHFATPSFGGSGGGGTSAWFTSDPYSYCQNLRMKQERFQSPSHFRERQFQQNVHMRHIMGSDLYHVPQNQLYSYYKTESDDSSFLYQTPFSPVKRQGNHHSKSKGLSVNVGTSINIGKIQNYIQNGHKILIIMRGLPGSGKSYLASQIQGNGVVLSTDDFFVKNGFYMYDQQDLSKAHEWNKERVKTALEEGLTPIIVDNTNIMLWELLPYAQLADNRGYAVEVLEPQTHWKNNPRHLAEYNVHGVPLESIKRMKEKYEVVTTATVKTHLEKLKKSASKSEKCYNATTGSADITDFNHKGNVLTPKPNVKECAASSSVKSKGYIPSKQSQSLNLHVAGLGKRTSKKQQDSKSSVWEYVNGILREGATQEEVEAFIYMAELPDSEKQELQQKTKDKFHLQTEKIQHTEAKLKTSRASKRVRSKKKDKHSLKTQGAAGVMQDTGPCVSTLTIDHSIANQAPNTSAVERVPLTWEDPKPQRDRRSQRIRRLTSSTDTCQSDDASTTSLGEEISQETADSIYMFEELKASVKDIEQTNQHYQENRNKVTASENISRDLVEKNYSEENAEFELKEEKKFRAVPGDSDMQIENDNEGSRDDRHKTISEITSFIIETSPVQTVEDQLAGTSQMISVHAKNCHSIEKIEDKVGLKSKVKGGLAFKENEGNCAEKEILKLEENELKCEDKEWLIFEDKGVLKFNEKEKVELEEKEGLKLKEEELKCEDKEMLMVEVKEELKYSEKQGLKHEEKEELKVEEKEKWKLTVKTEKKSFEQENMSEDERFLCSFLEDKDNEWDKLPTKFSTSIDSSVIQETTVDLSSGIKNLNFVTLSLFNSSNTNDEIYKLDTSFTSDTEKALSFDLRPSSFYDEKQIGLSHVSEHSNKPISSSPRRKVRQKKNKTPLTPFLKDEIKVKLQSDSWKAFDPERQISDSGIGSESNDAIFCDKTVSRFASTQTEVKDTNYAFFAELGNAGDRLALALEEGYYFVVSKGQYSSQKFSEETQVVVPKSNNHVIMLDKGTYVDFTPDPLEPALEVLQSCFPEVASIRLQEVLDVCQGNMEWATNLLLDWGVTTPLTSEDKLQLQQEVARQSLATPKSSFPASGGASTQHLFQPLSLFDTCQRKVIAAGDTHLSKEVQRRVIDSSCQRLQRIESQELERVKSIYDNELLANSACSFGPPHLSTSLPFSSSCLPKSFSMTVESVSSTSTLGEDKLLMINASEETVSPAGSAVENSTKGKTDENIHSGKSQIRKYDGIVKPTVQMLENGGYKYPKVNIETSEELTLDLPKAFVKRLEELFGSFQIPVEDSFVTVKLDYSTTSQLYTCLEQSLHQKQLKQDEALAQWLQSEEEVDNILQGVGGSISPAVLHQNNRILRPSHRPQALNLQDIMEEEMERQQQREKRLKRLEAAGTHSAIATKLKREKLYQHFPGIDEVFLEELFQANGFCLESTINSIEGTMGDKRPALHRLVPRTISSFITGSEMAAETDESRRIEAAKQQSIVDLLSSPQPNEKYQSLDSASGQEPDYQVLRQEATVHRHMRTECFEKAREAYRRGMKEVAVFYSQQGHKHTEKLQEANMRASQKILEFRQTKLESESTLDLHGFYVEEAIATMKHVLEEKERQYFQRPEHNRQFLFIITGLGKHSLSGVAKIRPAVIAHLTSSGYRFAEVKPGLFKVTLHPRRFEF